MLAVLHLPADIITVQFATMQFHFTGEFHHYMEGDVASFHCEFGNYGNYIYCIYIYIYIYMKLKSS